MTIAKKEAKSRKKSGLKKRGGCVKRTEDKQPKPKPPMKDQ